jgi:peptidyl-prolyl cis-trans isomerase-like 3
MCVSLNTSVGEIKVELFCESCPEACDNFLKLAGSGYFENCIFHRVLSNYLVQTGDPTYRGDGGRSIEDEPIRVEPFGDFSEAGTVAYAEIGEVRSQFFITAAPAPELAGKYTAFGRVIYGLNNVKAIARMPTFDDHLPIRSIQMNSITIRANPFAQ